MKVKEESEKADLKLNIKKTGIFLNYLLLNLRAGQETTEPDMEQ